MIVVIQEETVEVISTMPVKNRLGNLDAHRIIIETELLLLMIDYLLQTVALMVLGRHTSFFRCVSHVVIARISSLSHACP